MKRHFLAVVLPLAMVVTVATANVCDRAYDNCLNRCEYHFNPKQCDRVCGGDWRCLSSCEREAERGLRTCKISCKYDYEECRRANPKF